MDSVPVDDIATHNEGVEHPISITVKFGSESFSDSLRFPADARLDELLVKAADAWPAYDWEKSKLLVEKRPEGAKVKALFKAQDDDAFELSALDGATVKLLAPKHAFLQAASEASAAAQARRNLVLERARGRALAHRSRHHHRTAQEDAQYTFHTVRPLPYLPRPERSQAFLERLKADPGIRAAMRKHKFSVGLLTEMDPGQYTESNHEGTTRILGLNRNQGEVIELRLRTDAYDGYRDYKVIRKTLCHELAHNVHGPHDRNFWDLCHQIEREVATADWKSGGRSVGEEEFAPERPDEDEVMDHGGWTGGEFVLGGAGGAGGGSSGLTEGLSRREILARAAEQRLRNIEKLNQAKRDRSQNDRDESRS